MEYAKSINDDMVKQKEPEHLTFASLIAKEVISKFPPDQQNEIIAIVTKEVIAVRIEMIEKAEKHLSWLKDTFSALK